MFLLNHNKPGCNLKNFFYQNKDQQSHSTQFFVYIFSHNHFQKIQRPIIRRCYAWKKTIIVGGGLAGLTAANTLRKHGVEVVLYEAADVCGGRRRTEWIDGYEFYSGAVATEPQWQTTFQLIKELGLEARVQPGIPMRFAYSIKGKLRTLFLGATLSGVWENILFFFSGFPKKTYIHIARAFSALFKYMVMVDTRSHVFSALADISNLSTKDFLTQNNASLAEEWLFYPYMTMMVLERPSEISITHPISLFSLMKGSRTLDGGLGMISTGLYEKIKDCVRLRTPVKKIVIENRKVIGVETHERFVEADQVICAVDAHQALQLIPDLPDSMRGPLETCKYSSTYYYQFGLEEELISWKDTPAYVILHPSTQDRDTFLNLISLGSPKREKPTAIAATKGWFDDQLTKMNDEERRRADIQ